MTLRTSRFAAALPAALLLPLMSFAQSFWTPASGVPAVTITALTCTSDGAVYAGSGGADVWCSTDQGHTWQPRPLPAAGARITLLESVPASNMLFAGTQDHGLFRSSDGGLTWNGTSLAGTTITDLSAASSDRLFAVSGGGVVRSTDGGHAWFPAGQDARSVLAGSGSTVYAISQSGREVMRSTDDGQTWALRGTLQYPGVDLIRTGAGVLLTRLSGMDFILRSDDDGATWSFPRVGDLESGENVVAALYFASDGVVYAGLRNGRMQESGGGIRRSTDQGVTWSDAFEGLSRIGAERSYIVALASAPGGMLYAGSQAHGCFRSRDGFSWERADAVLPLDVTWSNGYPANYPPPSIVAFDNGVAIAGTAGQGLFTTTDSGRHWVQRRDLLPVTWVSRVVRAGEHSVYVVSNGNGIWRVNPQGGSVRITPPFRATFPLAIVRRSDGTTFSLALGDTLYRSTDDGDTWTAVSAAPIRHQLATLHADASGGLYSIGYDRIFRSTDDGVTWEGLGQPYPIYQPISAMTVDSRGTVYCSLNGMPPSTGHFFRRRAADTSWQMLFFDGGLPLAVHVFESGAHGRVYAATTMGIGWVEEDSDAWRLIPGSLGYVSALSEAPDGLIYAIGADDTWRSRAGDALDIEILSSVEADTLRPDPVSGGCTPNPFEVRVRVRNGTARSIDSLRVILKVQWGGTVTDDSVRQITALLLPGGVTAESVYHVRVEQLSQRSWLQLRCDAVLPEGLRVHGPVHMVLVPAREQRTFSGVVTADPNPVPWDTANWRNGGYRSPRGDYNLVRLIARISTPASVEAGRALATLASLPGITLETGVVPTQLVGTGRIPAGGADTAQWLLRVSGFTRDTVLTLRISVRDDSSGMSTDLSSPLEVRGAPPPAQPVVTLAIDPPDTLRYDAVLRDYEGAPSSQGAYTVFPVRLRLVNPAAFDLLDPSLFVSNTPGIRYDSAFFSFGTRLSPGDSLVMPLYAHADPDTVWRTVTVCAFGAARNADTISVCRQLVIEPFPKTLGSDVPPQPSGLAFTIHPNPAHGPVLFDFRLPEAATTAILVHDAIGRELRRVHAGTRPPGWHRVTLDLGELPPGLYRCTLHAGRHRTVRTLILTR